MKQITCPHCADTYPDFDVAHVCSKGPYAPKLKPQMNQRIQQLAVQAGAETWSRAPMRAVTGLAFTDENLEKFAELMIVEFTEAVKETATRVAQTAFNDGEDAVAVQKRVAGALRVLDVMRERFGVEE